MNQLLYPGHRVMVSLAIVALLFSGFDHVAVPTVSAQDARLQDHQTSSTTGNYFEGSPGSGILLTTILDVTDTYAETDSYLFPTINWFYNDQITGRAGRRKLPPPKASSYAEVILKVNQYSPNKRYVEIANRILDDYYRFAESHYVKTRSGEGLVFSNIPLVAGNSQGQPLHKWSDIAQLTHDPRAVRVLTALANQVKEVTVEQETQRGETEAFWWWWPWWYKDGESFKYKIAHTGHCYGVAGTISGLLYAHKVIPDHRFHDGTTPLDLANAGLEWLATQAIKREGGEGVDYPNVRSNSRTDNTGHGSGRGGIGEAFLRGYRANLDGDPKRAQRYLEMAKLTGIDIVEQLEGGWHYLGRSQQWQVPGKFWEYNLGWCGGVGGTPRFLFALADAVKESDPELAERCINSCRVVAKWFSDGAIPWKDGGYIWTSIAAIGAPKKLHFAGDYGVCGWVRSLHLLASRLDDPEIRDLAQGATQAMLSLGVKEEDQIRWPHIVPVYAGRLESATP